jgi:enterochelin esterase-like enzyme
MKQCLISFFSTVKTLLLLLVCFYSLKGFAQGGSEYYRSLLDTTLYCQSLAQARNLTVILPTTFNVIRKTKYPLLIVFDRQNRGIFRQMVESIDYLTRFDAMPEAIIIGVTSGQQRTLETSLVPKMEKRPAKN